MAKQHRFPASLLGISSTTEEADAPLVAHSLENFLPRKHGLELRKGFKYYKSLPNDPTRATSLFAINRYNRFEDPGRSWSLLFAINKIPWALELQTDTLPALTDKEVELLSNFDINTTVDGLTPQQRMDFPRPATTEYTDLDNNKNIVVCSDQSPSNNSPIDAMFTVATRDDQSNIRSSIDVTYVPTVWTSATRDDLPMWEANVIYIPMQSVVWNDKIYTMIRDTSYSSDVPPDQDIANANNPNTGRQAAWELASDPLHRISTSNFAFPIFYDNRLFFLEEGTNVVYASRLINENPSTDTIVNRFKIGYTNGQNLFACVLSTDTSDVGPNKWIVFVSTEGEVHIYPNLDISSPNSIRYRGRYQIGRPLGGKNSFMEINGDILVATEWGLISLQSALQKSVLIGESNAANQISDLWRNLVDKTKGKGDWFIQKSPTYEKFMIITPAGEPYSLAWCLDTKAFTIITKPISSVIEYGDHYLYASAEHIFTYEGGLDDAILDNKPIPQQINGLWIPHPTDFGNLFEKRVSKGYIRYQSINPLALSIDNLDHDDPMPIPAPPTAEIPPTDKDFPSTFPSTFKSVEPKLYRDDQDIEDSGTLNSPVVQFTSNQPNYSQLRVTSVLIDFEQGQTPT